MNFTKNDTLVFSAILAKHGGSIEAIKKFVDFIERIVLDDIEINQCLNKLIAEKKIHKEENGYLPFQKIKSTKITLTKVKKEAEELLSSPPKNRPEIEIEPALKK